MANRGFLPSAPNRTLWIAAVIIGVLGIFLHYVHVNDFSKYSHVMLMIGFILLVIGTAYKRI